MGDQYAQLPYVQGQQPQQVYHPTPVRDFIAGVLTEFTNIPYDVVKKEIVWRWLIAISKVLAVVLVVLSIGFYVLYIEEGTRTNFAFYTERLQDPGPVNSSCWLKLNSTGHLTDKDKSNRFCTYQHELPAFPFLTFGWIANGWICIMTVIFLFDRYLLMSDVNATGKFEDSTVLNRRSHWPGSKHFKEMLYGRSWVLILIFGVPFICVTVTLPAVLGFHELFVTLTMAALAIAFVFSLIVMTMSNGHYAIHDKSDGTGALVQGYHLHAGVRGWRNVGSIFACLFLILFLLLTTAMLGFTTSNIASPHAMWAAYLWYWAFIIAFLALGAWNLFLRNHNALEGSNAGYFRINMASYMPFRSFSEIVYILGLTIFIVGYFWLVAGLFYKYKFAV